jgi:predicted MFS family arabinose efflux permease
MLVGGFVALRRRPRRPLLVGNLGILLIAAPLGALALGWHVAPIAVAAFVAGVGVEFFEVNWATTLQQEIPTEKLSRVSSYDWLGSFALVPLGTILVGPLAAAIGLSSTLWVATAVVVAACLATLAVGEVRRLQARAGTEVVESDRVHAALAA